MNWLDLLPTLGLVVVVALSVLSAGHALLNKRKSRAALGWVIACLAWPGVGAVAYWALGVNRIEMRGRKLQARWPALPPDADKVRAPDVSVPEEVRALERVSYNVTRQPLVDGNRVTPLENGEQAYPAMLGAIEAARNTVFLSTYILDNDATGLRFADALSAAVDRGVDVRVLLDGIGERYSWRRMGKVLKRRGVPVERFLPPSFRPPGIQINLRNHRKLLVIDGSLAFTGGMNIGNRHLVDDQPEHSGVRDLHFEIEGPILSQIERVFLDDWGFVTGSESPRRPAYAGGPGGDAACRGVSDGPNENMDRLKWILIGAISAASRNIRIMTPYFLPDPELITALSAAALRGVDVEIVLPRRNNLPYVAWACQAQLWQVLRFGVRVFFEPGCFVHTKLLLVDGEYALVGSANLDPRSLRLNFEFDLEIYGGETQALLNRHFETARARAWEATEDALNARSVPVRLRDAFAALFSPYL